MSNHLVNLMIVGAMKCGTSTLANVLRGHPDICVSSPKEAHYFNRVADWRDELDRYHSCFEDRTRKILCDATPGYTCYPEHGPIWQDILEYNPDTKFIYIVRNPFERIVSHYCHAYQRGAKVKAIETELFSNPIFLQRTRYYQQIQPYIETFGRDNVLLIQFDDLIKKRESCLRQVASFIGVEAEPLLNQPAVHSNASTGNHFRKAKFDKFYRNKYLQGFRDLLPKSIWKRVKVLTDYIAKKPIRIRPQLDQATGNRIAELLHDDICQLERLMEVDLSAWKTFTAATTEPSSSRNSGKGSVEA
jgi:hypothetical protein